MGNSKYTLVLSAQFAMLGVDLFFNALSIFIYGGQNNTILLLIYILQDTLLVMSAIVLFVSFTATFVFQVGLIPLIFATFIPTILITVIYTLLSIAWHYTSLSASWDNTEIDIFESIPINIFYAIHKFVACLYYSFYKRAALHISDPKYNNDSDWLRAKFKNYFDLDKNQESVAATISENNNESSNK